MREERSSVRAAAFRLLLAAALSGCQATQYQPVAPAGGFGEAAGGFGEVDLGGNIWHLRFMHNAVTTRETAQSYWLYRAAELTLSKGYDGFEVLSQIGRARSSGDALSRGSTLLIEGEIRMLKKPFESVPPKIYNAEALKAVLDPYVTGAKSAATPVMSSVETPPPSTDGVRLKMMYSIQREAERRTDPTATPAAVPVEKPKPAPVVARPQTPAVPEAELPLKQTGPCQVKPVMTDQDLVNCGVRVR